MSCGTAAEIQGAQGESVLMTKKPKYDRSKVCVKCKENTGNIVIRHVVYCKSCFDPFVKYKFKKGLEPFVNTSGQKKAVLKPWGNLTIGFSGGLSSTVLLDLVRRCYYSSEEADEKKGNSPRNDAIWKKVTVCYVEVSEVYPETPDRTAEVARFIQEFYPTFEFVPIYLSNAFDKRWWRSICGGSLTKSDFAVQLDPDLAFRILDDSPSTPLESLQAYFRSLPTQTAVHSSVQTLIRVLLLHIARTTNSSHLLLGTSLTSLAISLISGVSQGGGYNVREEAQEDWTPPSTSKGGKERPIRLVRPLRDIGVKECGTYAWWRGLKVIGKEKWSGGRQSITGLTKDFILGLEKDYPSTVSTITRTCAKLVPKDKPAGFCSICQRPVQGGLDRWKSQISIRSMTEVDSTPSMQDPPLDSLAPLLCYSCQGTLTSRSSKSVAIAESGGVVSLPVWTQAKLADRERMKGEIQEFLLSDDEDG